MANCRPPRACRNVLSSLSGTWRKLAKTHHRFFPAKKRRKKKSIRKKTGGDCPALSCRHRRSGQPRSRSLACNRAHLRRDAPQSFSRPQTGGATMEFADMALASCEQAVPLDASIRSHVFTSAREVPPRRTESVRGPYLRAIAALACGLANLSAPTLTNDWDKEAS